MIKIFAMDVDGTLTDGKINISENGELYKSFNVKDGLGIKLLLANNIIPIIITGRISKIIEYRAKELGIEYIFQNISDKKKCLIDVCKKFNITLDEIAYIGDDINDLDAIKSVGISFAPIDSHEKVLNEVTYKCLKKGGEGAVREAIDYILNM